MARFQDQGGLWHQVMDKPDSYPETSGTAMFVYAVAKAVNEKWIPATYRSIAMEGWKKLSEKVRADGSVEDVCIGTGIADNISFYYNRPKVLNDFHVSGAILLAGTEMMKMSRQK
jgi:rhamnogalacturonyl hydrolase YesR